MKRLLLLALLLSTSAFSFSQTSLTLYVSQDVSLGYHDFESSENNNYGDAPHLSAFAIDATIPSGLLANRGLFDFDLSSITSSSDIDSAFLNLYADDNDPLPALQGHHGNNSVYLRRVTEQWGEYTVSWNTQPSTTSQNELILPQSTSSDQDYLNIDVTTLVKDMVDNPSSSFGFKIQLVDETKYKNLRFQSKDGIDPQKIPMLKVYLKSNTSVNEYTNENNFDIYPNPSNGEFNISFNDVGVKQVEIYTMDGKLIRSLQTSEMKSLIDLSDLSKGIYFIKCFSEDNSFSKKLILN